MSRRPRKCGCLGAVVRPRGGECNRSARRAHPTCGWDAAAQRRTRPDRLPAAHARSGQAGGRASTPTAVTGRARKAGTRALSCASSTVTSCDTVCLVPWRACVGDSEKQAERLGFRHERWTRRARAPLTLRASTARRARWPTQMRADGFRGPSRSSATRFEAAARRTARCRRVQRGRCPKRPRPGAVAAASPHRAPATDREHRSRRAAHRNVEADFVGARGVRRPEHDRVGARLILPRHPAQRAGGGIDADARARPRATRRRSSPKRRFAPSEPADRSQWSPRAAPPRRSAGRTGRTPAPARDTSRGAGTGG